MVSAIQRSKRTAMTSEPIVRDYRLALESARGRPRAAARRRGERYFAGRPPGRRGGAFLACQGRSSHGLAHLVALERGAAAVLWEPAPVSRRRRFQRRWSVSPFRLSAHGPVNWLTGSSAAPPPTSRSRVSLAPTARPPPRTARPGRRRRRAAWRVASARWAPAARAVLPAPISPRPTPYRCIAGWPRRATTAPRCSRWNLSFARPGSRGRRRFDTAVFTKLSRDHLDLQELEAYGDAKARLFQSAGLQAAVIDVRDPLVAGLRRCSITPSRRSGSRPGAELISAPRIGWIRLSGMRARDRAGAACREQLGRRQAPLPARRRVQRREPACDARRIARLARAAAAGARRGRRVPGSAGQDGSVRRRHPSGRDRRLRPPPDALAKLLDAARACPRSPALHVFGCGGDRDAGKRPQMGAIAEELADAVVLTNDNPRTEDPRSILEQIVAGMREPSRAVVIPDRADAIRHALSEAVRRRRRDRGQGARGLPDHRPGAPAVQRSGRGARGIRSRLVMRDLASLAA